jgi:pSer/pThr/pTyr-binding forkhead associated (FHA) protein
MLLGAIGFGLGNAIGSPIFNAIAGGGDRPIFILLPARTIALTFGGAGLGLGIGAASLNQRKVVQGLIGGAIGGAISGALFDIVSDAASPFILAIEHSTRAESGGPGRALFAALIGATIALFIGLVERIARSAWVRLELGRNEGREWSIDGPTEIGRSETAQVPIFGDPQIAPRHCAIQPQGDHYWLTDLGSPAGTLLNGQRLAPDQQAALFHGASIGVGSSRLTFLLKGQPAPMRVVDGRMRSGSLQQPVAPLSGPMQAASMAGPGMTQTMVAPGPAMGSPVSGMAPTIAMPGPAMTPTTAMPTPGASYMLVATDGPLVGQRFPINGPVEMGRETPFVPLAFDGAVSRRHVSISPMPNGVVVNDLGSSNGTFVDGQRIQQAMLQPGHMLRVGTTTFRLEA